MASLLYIAGITVFSVQDGYGYRAADTYHYWWLLILAIPHYLLLVMKRPTSNFTLFHHWVIPISLTICLGTLAGSEGRYMTIAYISLFSAFYQVGTSAWFSSFDRLPPNGYLVLGSLGTMGILLALSFKDFWIKLAGDNNLLSLPEWLAIILTTLFALYLLVQNIKKRGAHTVDETSLIFLVFIGVFFTGIFGPVIATILINLLVLAVGIFTIRRGLAMNHLGVLNYGLLIVAALVICRFFDTGISFVVRGLLFVAVGAGFFYANSRLIKRRKQLEQ
jgi:hypothetical protein